MVIDLKAELDKLYNDYLREAILLSLGGLMAIVLLLAAALRSPRTARRGNAAARTLRSDCHCRTQFDR